MELNDLIFLGACALLSRNEPSNTEVRAAVWNAKRVWKEVLKQEREKLD